MEMTLTHSEKEIHAKVSGEIDERGAEDLKRRFGQVKLSDGIGVTFDFGDVTHIGSSGLGKLLLFYKMVSSYNGSIRFERLSQPVYDLFQQLKLNTIFGISRKA